MTTMLALCASLAVLAVIVESKSIRYSEKPCYDCVVDEFHRNKRNAPAADPAALNSISGLVQGILGITWDGIAQVNANKLMGQKSTVIIGPGTNNTNHVMINSGGWNQPIRGGWNQPIRGGWNQPIHGGWNQPNGGGWNQPIYGGWNQPNGGGWNQPNGGGLNQPNSGGWNQPNSGGWNQPNGGGWNQPNSGGSNQPSSGSWNQPNSGSWNQPNSGGWNQPNSSGWNQPNSGGSKVTSRPQHNINNWQG
ncbi:uncharacterized protein [Maniola hyperantus]|uniref:uncharacterized protein isoform X1 n=1 Tax=Aphantopus hyperantus TaxID=2795564 RepID=UPI00213953FB